MYEILRKINFLNDVVMANSTANLIFLERTSIDKLPPSDWPVGMCLEYFFLIAN